MRPLPNYSVKSNFLSVIQSFINYVIQKTRERNFSISCKNFVSNPLDFVKTYIKTLGGLISVHFTAVWISISKTVHNRRVLSVGRDVPFYSQVLVFLLCILCILLKRMSPPPFLIYGLLEIVKDSVFLFLNFITC